MAKPKELVAAAKKKLKGKKAKTKTLNTEPSGTKSKPLNRTLRLSIEEEFGAKLQDVKVHTGGNASDLAKELGARAFTIGNDIYFGKPADAQKPELLIHEITHALQQKGGQKLPAAKKGKALTSK